MKKINIYITEKLHLNKDIEVDNLEHKEAIDEIIELCDLKESDTLAIKTISDWVKKTTFKKINKITDLFYLKRDGKLNLFTHADKFEDNHDLALEIYKDIIINSKGKEVVLGGWNMPKIYYNDKILIYHDYNKYNIDKIFVKEQ